MKTRILITGGSGFIGTNLIEYLLRDESSELMSIDIVHPKIKKHSSLWVKVNLCDKQALFKAVVKFNPEYVIHLGARTDLNGKKLDDYDANMRGVSNLLNALESATHLKRAIFASSMYVCEPGYMPKDFEDYAPHTLYSKSKMETERIIKTRNPKYVWSIIRPTSIWGPWFGEPYDNFFHIVLNRMYFHMGAKACEKTYGNIDTILSDYLHIKGCS